MERPVASQWSSWEGLPGSWERTTNSIQPWETQRGTAWLNAGPVSQQARCETVSMGEGTGPQVNQLQEVFALFSRLQAQSSRLCCPVWPKYPSLSGLLPCGPCSCPLP